MTAAWATGSRRTCHLLALEQGVQDEAWAGLGSPAAQGKGPGCACACGCLPAAPAASSVSACAPPPVRIPTVGRGPTPSTAPSSEPAFLAKTQPPAPSRPGSRRTGPLPDSSAPEGPRSPVQALPVVAGCLKPQDRKDSDGCVEGRHAVHQRDAHRVPPAVVPGQSRVASGPRGGLGQGAPPGSGASQSPPHNPRPGPQLKAAAGANPQGPSPLWPRAGVSWGPWVWVPGLQMRNAQ